MQTPLAPPGAEKPRPRGEFWHFCTAHAADYNKRWNYFAGMSEAEWADYQAREEIGHRPTWTFRGGRPRQASAAMRGFKAGQGYRSPWHVRFGEAAHKPVQRRAAG
jgi:hypothetical protein